jgi:hypothetical protein
MNGQNAQEGVISFIHHESFKSYMEANYLFPSKDLPEYIAS